MRLYLKLAAFGLALVLIQSTINRHRELIRETIFGLRCGLAWQARDERAIEALVWEGQLDLRRRQSDSSWQMPPYAAPRSIEPAPPVLLAHGTPPLHVD